MMIDICPQGPYIASTISHHILTEKLEMVHVALARVLHMLTSDQMRIHEENPAKF